MEIVVNDSEAFPGVVAPISPAHQVLNNQTHINQSDLIVGRQMTLQQGTDRWVRLNGLWLTSADNKRYKVNGLYLFNISNQVEESWVVGRLFLKEKKAQKALQHSKTFTSISLQTGHVFNSLVGWCLFHMLPCCRAPPADWLWGNGACSRRFLWATSQNPPCPSRVHPALLAPESSPIQAKNKQAVREHNFLANHYL